MSAIILPPGEGRSIMMGPVRIIILENGTNTRGTMGIAEFIYPPHSPSPFPHIHRAHEEGFYVLEGELEFQANGETIQAGTGSFVMVPIGVVHSFSNPSEKSARFLNTFTPPQYIHYFEEMSELFSKSGPPTLEEARALMARYDTDIIV